MVVVRIEKERIGMRFFRGKFSSVAVMMMNEITKIKYVNKEWLRKVI